MITTWAAISIFLTLVTPAMPFLFWIRLSFPRATTSTSSDFTFIITGCLLGGLCNLNLFGSMAQSIFQEFANLKSFAPTDQQFISFLLKQNYHPLRPTLWIERMWTGKIPSPYDLSAFFWDLHIRTFLLGIIFWGFFFFGSMIENYYEGLQWNRHLSEFHAKPVEESSRYISEHATKRGKLAKFLNYIRQVFYHPWALSTQTFKSRELLMVDVLTKDDGMYSGLFVSYAPDGNSISNVGLEYAVHYSLPGAGYNESNLEESMDLGSNQKHHRKKSFIKNNGQLIIPIGSISNIHFWEIRKGFHLKILIEHESWGEILKQYLILYSLFPGFIQSILLDIDMQTIERERFISDFRDWIIENGLKLDGANLKIVDRQKHEPVI